MLQKRSKRSKQRTLLDRHLYQKAEKNTACMSWWIVTLLTYLIKLDYIKKSINLCRKVYKSQHNLSHLSNSRPKVRIRMTWRLCHCIWRPDVQNLKKSSPQCKRNCMLQPFLGLAKWGVHAFEQLSSPFYKLRKCDFNLFSNPLSRHVKNT